MLLFFNLLAYWGREQRKKEISKEAGGVGDILGENDYKITC